MQNIPPPPAMPGDYIPGVKPKVVTWYKVYVIFVILMFLCVAGIGAVFLSGVLPIPEEEMDDVTMKLTGIIYLAMGVIFAIPYIACLFFPRKKWAWIFHLVLICLGMTGCTIVASIPLLIFWIKPDVKGYFDETLR